KAIEDAFREYGRGKVLMPPKIYLHLDRFSGDFRAMPAYIEKLNRCVLKWVNVHPNNQILGLPAVMAINILSDPKNGFPLCIMDGTYATSLRTGAAGAVAAKYLARGDSKVLALVGCGVQARTQLKALREIFSLKEARIWGNEARCVRSFINDMKSANLKLIGTESVEDCVRDSDIVVTTTPSRSPIVKLKYLKIGAHINAIGADARGKQELEPAILKKAKLVVDSWEQASHSGEINVPFKKGLITRGDIYADIGEIVAGKKKGRTSPDELTVFDSTGLAIQDVAICDLIYKTALKTKTGRWVKLV
ncbi:MAG: ornithine cyclodeaminase family protein, partial [Candidatus Omnitrophica bacterium]|nr:ornithine cyclodeaminase family protein [Candidatus Omnitrophota bacterium]